MTDIQIGSPGFDQTYHISGGSDDAVRTLLSTGVQMAIENVRGHSGNGHVYVQFSGGTLLVKKLGLESEYDSLAHLVVLSLEVFEQALLTRGATGIQFLDAPATGRPVCLVCGSQIVTDLVHCKSCKTAHHQECWKYYGACSTYGCGEKRFVKARS
jgi:hypothetical protein